MPVRLVEAKFHGRRNRRGSHVSSARWSFFTIREYSAVLLDTAPYTK